MQTMQTVHTVMAILAACRARDSMTKLPNPLHRHHARATHGRDCKNAKKRQKYCVFLYIIPG